MTSPLMLFTQKEVCELLRISRQELYRKRRQRGFPAPIKVGERKICFVRSEVYHWIEERRRARPNTAA